MTTILFSAILAALSLTWDADHRGATIDNGQMKMHITSGGNVSSVRYADQEMILSGKNGNVYFSYESDSTRNGRLNADTVMVVRQTAGLVELVYRHLSPVKGLQWEVGYIVRQGVCGYYTYAALKSTKLASGIMNSLHEARIVHRLNPKIFNYAWVSDDNQGPQPSTELLKNPVEKIQDATFLLSDSCIYTKYDYCNYVKDDQLHGMMGDNVGAWLITPSFEWVNGGVNKQELTVHGDVRSPLILQMWQSWHFGTGPADFRDGDQKFYGPSLVYFNQGSHESMIADAKRRTQEELGDFPYPWMTHHGFVAQRGSVKGHIALDKAFCTNRFQVVLTQTDEHWSQRGNGYQFWAETDDKGDFLIPHVRPGTYTLYAYALNGEATGQYEKKGIKVKAGKNDVGHLTWNLEKYGTTLWRIGEADHRSSGFRLSDHRRQYGVFKEVPADLTYTIGKSKPEKDWYYAQTKNGRWNIVFYVDKVYSLPLRLTIALAGATNQTRADVIINGKRIGVVKTENDSGIYRCAMQSGQPTLYTFDVQPDMLRQGKNTLSLKVGNIKHVGGIMYDCIKLEANK